VRRPETSTTAYPLEVASPVADEAELAAAAFIARYSGRTPDAYRHDVRSFFQWTADHGVETLAATRAHMELYRMSMEQRGIGRADDRPAPVDRVRLLPLRTHRRPHPANPAQYVRRPRLALRNRPSTNWLRPSPTAATAAASSAATSGGC
jgi:hypothetical protein